LHSYMRYPHAIYRPEIFFFSIFFFI
jgi:hypothetical protein